MHFKFAKETASLDPLILSLGSLVRDIGSMLLVTLCICCLTHMFILHDGLSLLSVKYLLVMCVCENLPI